MLLDSVSDSAPDSARPMATGGFGETTAPDVLASSPGSEELPTPFRPELCGNSGMPIEVHWEAYKGFLTDGFGLCSPSRWLPAARGKSLASEAKQLSADVYRMVEVFVQRCIKSPETTCGDLAAGRLKSSPFPQLEMDRLRAEMAGRLQPGEGAGYLLEIPTRQPFLLRLLSEAARQLNDPDWEVLTEGAESYCEGVPVGVGTEIGHVPQVFSFKDKHRTLDVTALEYDRGNYKSAEASADLLQQKFEAEERLGRMVPTTISSLRAERPDADIRVASMGAIVKADGTARPIHDGTHGVNVNNQILIKNQLSVPGPAEVAFVARQPVEQLVPYFSLSADVSAAHRLCKHRECDWPLLCCRVRDQDKVIWMNTVGTFGISSASFWWARLFGLVGRTVTRFMMAAFFYHLAYVDDVHGTFLGKRRFIHALMWLALFELFGTPFSYPKFHGGSIVTYIGYELSYDEACVGISLTRTEWLIGWMRDARTRGYIVCTRRFAEFLGRLGFTARLVYWIKPHLAPLYSWASATHRSTVATLPRTVIYTFVYLEHTLVALQGKVSARKETSSPQPAFFTDAKCAPNLVVLGGWLFGSNLKRCKWFSLRLTPLEAPYLFDKEGRSNWASTSAELLGTLVALHAFGFLKPHKGPRRIPIGICGGTDNRSNEAVTRRATSTRWPLMLVNMCLSDLLRKAALRLSLAWRPRDQNVIADRLTNEVFSDFDSEHRVPVCYEDLPLKLLHDLWETKEEFSNSKSALASAPLTERKRKRDKSPW